jgi:hypothetical protein
MTNVLNLNTGNWTLYTLSPVEAVIAAYAQHEKRNFNTWEYGKYAHLVSIEPSVKSRTSVVTCGSQSCLCAIGNENVYPLQDYEVATI